jgi:hypothetical protein
MESNSQCGDNGWFIVTYKWPWISRKRIVKLESDYANLIKAHEENVDRLIAAERVLAEYKRDVHNFAVQATANLYQSPDALLRGRVLQAMQSLDQIPLRSINASSRS